MNPNFTLYAIVEKSTGTVCTSIKHAHFGYELRNAALFNTRKSAEKALRVTAKRESWCVMREDDGIDYYAGTSPDNDTYAAAWGYARRDMELEIREVTCNINQ